MTTLLAEERRIERQLYRQSVCSESDSNQESRDSGVELDHKHPELTWSHSRNDSEISADVQVLIIFTKKYIIVINFSLNYTCYAFYIMIMIPIFLIKFYLFMLIIN